MSDVRMILLTDVQAVQDGQLMYRDEAGNPASIDLADCARRWAQAHPEAYPDAAQCRCVGGRWFLPAQGKAYFELYTAPQRTRLYTPVSSGLPSRLMLRLGLLPPVYRRAWSCLHALQTQLQAGKWTVCDMT